MSIKSTRTITRETVEDMYKEFLIERMDLDLAKFNNEELGDMLDEATTDIFSNYTVIDDGDEEVIDNAIYSYNSTA